MYAYLVIDYTYRFSFLQIYQYLDNCLVRYSYQNPPSYIFHVILFLPFITPLAQGGVEGLSDFYWLKTVLPSFSYCSPANFMSPFISFCKGQWQVLQEPSKHNHIMSKNLYTKNSLFTVLLKKYDHCQDTFPFT